MVVTKTNAVGNKHGGGLKYNISFCAVVYLGDVKFGIE